METDSGTRDGNSNSNTSGAAPEEVSGSRRRKRRMPLRLPAAEAGPAVPSNAAVSRESCATPQPDSAAGTSSPGVKAEAPLNGVVKKQKTRWPEEVADTFYEAHGKDFAQITKHINRVHSKTRPRELEQVRSYYYNIIKKVSPHVDKGKSGKSLSTAKELFMIVNFAEWKRKTGGKAGNFDPVKFNELMMNGSVSIRVRGKQLLVRTPNCPSLKRLCEESTGRDARVLHPSTVVLNLAPCSFADKAYVLKCEQNPFVRASLAANETLHSWLHYLTHKWMPPQTRRRCATLKKPVDAYLPCVRLKLAADMSVDTTVLQQMQKPASNSSLCFSRYVKQHQSQKDASSQSAAEENSLDKSEAQQPGSLELEADDVLNEGVTLANSKTLTVAQLYLMCLPSQVINLVYEVTDNSACTQPDLTPWSCLITLLSRGFGDELAKNKPVEIPPMLPPASEQVVVSSTHSAAVVDTIAQPQATTSAVAVSSAAPHTTYITEQVVEVARVSVGAGSSDMRLLATEHRVVENENAQFLQQLSAKRSRSRRTPAAPATAVVGRPLMAPMVAEARSLFQSVDTDAFNQANNQPAARPRKRSVASASAAQDVDVPNFGEQQQEYVQLMPVQPAPVVNHLPSGNSTQQVTFGEHSNGASMPHDVRNAFHQLTDEGSLDFLRANIDDRFIDNLVSELPDSNSALLSTPNKVNG